MSLDLTDHLRPEAARMNKAFCDGVEDSNLDWLSSNNAQRAFARWLWAGERERWGLTATPVPLLTPPTANLKLAKASVPSYGLTLQHYVQRVTPKLVINACPNAGDCTKMCVLDNGMGRFAGVQLARRAKTAFLATQPAAFAYLLGWELERAQRKHGRILFRPNVNSDVAWEQLLPSMVVAHGFSHDWRDSMLYGYTKRTEVLGTRGWLGESYRVAYSWNEKSDPVAVAQFLERGGSVAVVTDRKKGDFVPRQFHLPGHPEGFFVNHYRHVDADLTDEWIFKQGVIGDLSAKGRARKFISKTDFIVREGASS